jgi:antitoxin HicB
MTNLKYAVIVEPLPEPEGGGFLASASDLPGCMTDGETPEAALDAIRSAIDEWIAEATRLGRAVPAPTKPVA